jgi:hypothetical protein
VNYTNIKTRVRLIVLHAVLALALFPTAVVKAFDNPNGPVLPAECGSIEVPAGNKLAFHVYARGVQIYKWNGTSWDFVAPVASLFAEEKYFGEVGNHYVGPTWESKSGSKVVGRRVTGTGCTPDPNAIPWLLLERVTNSGAGIFSAVTYIQRVSTTEGIPPTSAGLLVGEIREVPYTAEYYFYRADTGQGQAALRNERSEIWSISMTHHLVTCLSAISRDTLSPDLKDCRVS